MELRRRHVLLAVLAAFIAWGYATHWVPSIRWIPYFFLSGVLATIGVSLWLILTTTRSDRAHRRQVLHRKDDRIAFIAPQTWALETAAQRRRLLYRRDPIYPPSLEVSKAADRLLDNILRDFVHSWYSKISHRSTFTNEVDRTIRTALKNIVDRIIEHDVVDIVISRLIPIITEHLRAFDEAERAVRGRKLSTNVTESEELDLAIAAKFRDGKLHPAASLAYANPKSAQQHHLRGIVTRCLPQLLPADLAKSAAVVVLIKEIVACAVLYPVTQALIDPDTWNKLLEGYGRALLQERKTVRKLRAALDEHAPPSPTTAKPIAFPKLSANDSERRFERFIRTIRKCNNLSDARRFRSEVASQLWKESNVEGQDPLYLRRLETGKRMLDQKIASLGAGAFGKPKMAVQPPTHTSTLENASLREVLYNASGLSYFMEYMERLNLIRLVQFWIVVDGFRNPLEVDTDDPSEYVGGDAYWTDADRTDLAQIHTGYLSKPELKISPLAREAVKTFLRAGKDATGPQYHAARRAVLRAQTVAYEEMQDTYFRDFKKSDLWFKLLASEEREAVPPAPPSPTSSVGTLEEFRKQLPSTKARAARSGMPNNALKPTDLRRAVVSATNLKDVDRSEGGPSPRRSLDDSNRAPLFDDDPGTDPLADSVQSLDSDSGPTKNAQDPKVVDAMQTALNNILEETPDRDSLFSDTVGRTPQESDSIRSSLEFTRASSPALRKGKLSIASLGLVGGPASQGVFHDDLFDDEQKFIEDEREDSDDIQTPVEDEIHEAAPGDLGLAEAIDALTMDIEKLVTQESIVDSLMKKAELTNNAAELRILRKSKASLQREINRKELQRQQYIVQESDSSLYGRATVSITSIMVGQEPEGKEYALYVIEVQRQAGEQMPAAAWVVARRYSEFHELNKRLRSRYAAVRNLEFPRRQMVLKLQKDFLQKRRSALERYLQELLLIPAICRSRELRAFLSQSSIVNRNQHDVKADTRDFVSRIYNSVTDGMEEFLGNIPVLDQLSLAGQNLISAAATQLAASNAQAGLNDQPPNPAGLNPCLPSTASPLTDDPETAAEAEAELQAYDSRELLPLVKPISDLFLETFELNRESNWLRGRAVVVVLHQLLGGTVERKVRDAFRTSTAEDAMVRWLVMARELLWPGDGPFRESEVRTAAEKAASRREAGALLSVLIPDLVGSVVGRSNATGAGRRVLAVLNNSRLNTHLVFTLLDEVVQVVFGDFGVR